MSTSPNCSIRIWSQYIFYPPPSQRLVWNYKKAVESSMRKALVLVNWEELFRNKNTDI